MENKSLIWIVGMFLAGLTIGGLFSGAFTGRASNINKLTASETSIFISPAKANYLDILSITVDSRNGGASPVAYVRDDQGDRRDRIVWCRGLDDFGNPVVRSGGDEDSSCFARVTFEYKLLSSYDPGIYYVEVFDIETGEYARAYFEVLA